MSKNYYEILNLAPNAQLKDIANAYIIFGVIFEFLIKLSEFSLIISSKIE